MNKVRRFFAGVLCLAVTLTLFLGNGYQVSAAENDDTRLINVSFVMDCSGSMSQSDANNLRYAAMEWFMTALQDEGNHIGGVVFNDKVEELGLYMFPQVRNGKYEKEQVAFNLSTNKGKNSGDTNIGGALLRATEDMVQYGDPNLPSYIILLTDGNSDMPTQQGLESSLGDKRNAVTLARNNNIPIYTICLNADGKADVTEMQEIAEDTGGICTEVRSSEDLQDVFASLYGILFDAGDDEEIYNKHVKAGEIVEAPFNVPLLGVKEAKITINTPIDNPRFSLYRPDGSEVPSDELADMTSKVASYFCMIKVPNPEAGTWKLVVHGAERDYDIRISLICDSTEVGIDFSSSTTSASPNQKVHLESKLVESGQAVNKPDLYNTYPIKLNVKNVTTGAVEEFDMNPESDKCSYDVQFADEGTYEMWATFQVLDYDLVSTIAQVSVMNSAPISTTSTIEIKEKVWPFTQPRVENVGQYVTDVEDAVLTYTVSASDFTAQDAYLDQDNLVLNISSCGDGALVITATDSGGKSVSISVEVETTNMVKLLLLIIIPLIVLILVIIIVVKVADGRKAIRGSIQIRPYGESYMPADVQEGDRGKMYIGRYWNFSENVGIDVGRDYFFHGKKEDHIFLITKKGYYTSESYDKKQKKIRLDGQVEMKISSDLDFTRGIYVTYIPDESGY